MGTDEEDLAKFRRQRLGPSSTVSLLHLQRLRDTLTTLAEALRADDEERWSLVERAWQVLQPAADDEPEHASAGAPAARASEPNDTARTSEPPIPKPAPAAPARPSEPSAEPAPMRPALADLPKSPPPWRPRQPGASAPPPAGDDRAAADVPVPVRASTDWEEHTALAEPDGVGAERKPVLPFAPPDGARKPPGPPLVEPPDPEDPETETVRLRAHVLPFRGTPRPAPDGDTRTEPLPQTRFGGPPEPPPSQPTRITSRPRRRGDERSAPADEPTDVSSMAKTQPRERPHLPRGRHGLPIVHDDDDDDGDEHRPTQVRAAPVAMRVDRYALFCAQCAVHREPISEIRSRHGVLDEAEHQRLDRGWADRFAANPVLQQKWQILFDVQRTKLLRGKG